mgnify:CR=1 FL=1
MKIVNILLAVMFLPLLVAHSGTDDFSHHTGMMDYMGGNFMFLIVYSILVILVIILLVLAIIWLIKKIQKE